MTYIFLKTCLDVYFIKREIEYRVQRDLAATKEPNETEHKAARQKQ
jgi:hypothetical protein